MKLFKKISATILFLAIVSTAAWAVKTTFSDGNPALGIKGTRVYAAFLNAINNHYHTGLANDGDGALPYAVDSGAANAYVVTLSPALTQYVNGMPVYFKAANANTGISTVNINGLGVKTIKKNGSTDLYPGDIRSGQIVEMAYDGTNFQLQNPLMETTAIPAANAIPILDASGSLTPFLNNLAINNWFTRTMPSSQPWRGLTYGNGTWIAVSNTATSTAGASSTDSVTWTARTLPSPGSGAWAATAYGNNMFVATAFTTAAASSPDGITWTAQTLPGGCTATWYALTYGNGKFVGACGNGSAGAYSTDGITWSSSSMPVSAQWSAIAAGNGIFVALESNMTGTAATSTNGISWTQRVAPTTASRMYTLAFGNGQFVALAGVNAYTTTDGISWASYALPLSKQWTSLTFGNGVFVGGADDTIISSPNGATWTVRMLHPTGTGPGINGLAYGNGRFASLSSLTGTTAFSTLIVGP